MSQQTDNLQDTLLKYGLSSEESGIYLDLLRKAHKQL
jgi:hypothetical protein